MVALLPSPAMGATGPGVAVHRERGSVLYSHDASGGTFRPAHRRGEYLLTLQGVPARTLFFSDRPRRHAGYVATGRLLESFFAKPGESPPNAAVSVRTPSGAQRLVAFELLGARYDRARHRLRYRTRRLPGAGASTVAGRTVDVTRVLPVRFGQASVFIDDGGNSCQVSVYNGSSTTYTLQSSTAYTYDTWEFDDGTDGHPPGTIPGSIDFGDLVGVNYYGAYWETVGGWARGCWNDVVYTGSDGTTLEIRVSDPFTGPNDISCTVTPTPTGGDVCTAGNALLENTDTMLGCANIQDYVEPYCTMPYAATRPTTQYIEGPWPDYSTAPSTTSTTGSNCGSDDDGSGGLGDKGFIITSTGWAGCR